MDYVAYEEPSQDVVDVHEEPSQDVVDAADEKPNLRFGCCC